MRLAIAIAAALAIAAPAALADTSSSGSIAGSAPGAPSRASLPDIEDEVMCPICGTTLQLSNSPQADRERALIRTLIAAGLTKDQIKDELVAEYGADVLAEPDSSGFDLTAWLLPLIGFALAALGIGLALRRWRRAPRAGGEPTPPKGEEAERLDADLSRYDL